MKIRQRRASEKLPWKLLFEADPSKKEVQAYCERGETWFVEEKGIPVGVMVLMQTRVGVLEIMNIGFLPEFRGRGLGTLLLRKALKRARALRAKKLEVGTGNNSFRQLQFYQRFGFRIVGVDKDFFVGRYPKLYQNGGVVLRDMIRMELPLQ